MVDIDYCSSAVFQAVKGELATYEMYEAYFKQDTDTDWTKMQMLMAAVSYCFWGSRYSG